MPFECISLDYLAYLWNGAENAANSPHAHYDGVAVGGLPIAVFMSLRSVGHRPRRRANGTS